MPINDYINELNQPLSEDEVAELERRLAIAKKTTSEEIVKECNYATAIFTRRGYPNNWTAYDNPWKKAGDDAQWEIDRWYIY